LFLPILSRHHFLHQLVHKPDEMDRLLCYAVCAMGSRYLEHRDDMERLYFERCLLLFDKLKQDEPTIASVQVRHNEVTEKGCRSHLCLCVCVVVIIGCDYYVLVYLYDGRL
jgi:hypothetical protein